MLQRLSIVALATLLFACDDPTQLPEEVDTDFRYETCYWWSDLEAFLDSGGTFENRGGYNVLLEDDELVCGEDWEFTFPE